MSVRKKTPNRWTLFRVCHVCGKSITTTADTPFVRQLYNVDGKKQKTCYFCSQTCKNSTYKHKGWFDGKADERRRLKDANRDPVKVSEKNRKYYQANREKILEYHRRLYWSDTEAAREINAYNRHKRELMERSAEHGESQRELPNPAAAV